MELIGIILLVVALVFIASLYAFFKNELTQVATRQYNLKKQIQDLHRYIGTEHKKTRKETQELKTRSAQDRKDLNEIQKKIK